MSLNKTINQITIEEKCYNPCYSSYWKKECEIQYANKRIRNQWSVKFSSRVLINPNIPIRNIGRKDAKIYTSDDLSPLLGSQNVSFRDSQNHGFQNNGECSTVPFPRKSTVGNFVISSLSLPLA